MSALLVSMVPTVISALLGLILWLSWPAMGGLRRHCLQTGVQAKGMGWLEILPTVLFLVII